MEFAIQNKVPAHRTIYHIHQIVSLWENLCEIQLDEDMDDGIIWKHTSSGTTGRQLLTRSNSLVSLTSSLRAQFGENPLPLKVKFFAWLALQNRIWTIDMLAKRGWLNCVVCPLCKRENETLAHLFYKCRFNVRLWGMVKEWLHIDTIDTSSWNVVRSIKEWWIDMSKVHIPNRRVMASRHTHILGNLERAQCLFFSPTSIIKQPFGTLWCQAFGKYHTRRVSVFL